MREEKAMSDFSNGYLSAHHEYSYRLPTPPRIVVPPPTMNTDLPTLSVLRGGLEDADTAFLRQLDLVNILQKNTLIEWAYERRRQAQMILPWLYLGPMVAARDKAFLEREGITMVLAVQAQPNSMMGAIRAAGAVCLDVSTVEAANNYDLTARFSSTTDLINQHIARVRQHSVQTTGKAKLGKVLVFCESGNEKSAAVAAAYLIDTLQDFDHIKAMQVCQAQRFCVNFDDTIKNVLRSHWDIVQAQRSVAQMHYHEPGVGSLSLPSNQKRRIGRFQDDDEDTDMDTDDHMDGSDALRFAGRDVTPFRDA